jgi:catechol 2,3-dioxygenase-like lactoylglutathione lyase family enzyme
MKIKVTSLYVDNQDQALRFYTEVLSFVKKADFSLSLVCDLSGPIHT